MSEFMVSLFVAAFAKQGVRVNEVQVGKVLKQVEDSGVDLTFNGVDKQSDKQIEAPLPPASHHYQERGGSILDAEFD